MKIMVYVTVSLVALTSAICAGAPGDLSANVPPGTSTNVRRRDNKPAFGVSTNLPRRKHKLARPGVSNTRILKR